MSDIAWETTQSVVADVSLASAWNFMANVSNWADPPAEFALEGPFVTGSRGTTQFPGQEPLHWELREVTPEKTYTLLMPLDRASIAFEWRFDAIDAHHTRLSQRIVLSGENAAAYVSEVQPAFSANLAPGMEKIAATMGHAASRPSS